MNDSKQKMKKILFLIPNLMHGGAEKVLVNLVNNLDSSKYEVTLFSIFDEGVNKEFLNKNIKYRFKFKNVFRGNSHFLKLFSPKILYQWFVKEEYDIAISFLEGPAARIISGCQNPKTKKIAWIHTEIQDRNTAKVGFRTLKEAQKQYEKFDRIIGVSQNVVEGIQKFITTKTPSQVLYNVNETQSIIEKGKEPIDVIFSKEIPTLISVGKIVKIKGFDRLLEAHQQLIKEGILHEIFLVGIGGEEENLAKKAKDLGLSKSFKLLGFHKNPYQLMAKSDLYICSSHREGFSTAVTEALILGVPVVSTDVSGAKELLGENNEFGIVTDNSTAGIYEGLKTLLTQPEKLAHYKTQAEIRGKEFSTQKTVIAVEQLLDSLLHE